jgi:methionine biosynthesis protein MetW
MANVLRFLRKVHEKLAGPAPLDSYPDYDEYWERRKAEGRSPGLLYRYTKIAELLPRDAHVLDIGCGDGTFGAHLLATRQDCRYFGVDVSGASIEQARQRGLACQRIDPARTLREQLPIDVDCVTIMEVLEHVHDAEDLMAQALAFNPRRVYVTIPNVGALLHRVRLAVFGRFPVTTIIFHMKEHIRFWTYKDFVQWSGTMGLKVSGFHGQTGVGSKWADRLALRFPKLFALQVIYVLDAVEGKG